MQAPVLTHFNPANPIVVETDASHYTIAAIISQISPDDGDLHPIAFYSCGMKPAELNYEIYDKELLAIFEAFQQWRKFLLGKFGLVRSRAIFAGPETGQSGPRRNVWDWDRDRQGPSRSVWSRSRPGPDGPWW